MYLRILVLCFLSCFTFYTLSSQSQNTLTVEVQGIETFKGSVRACLISDKSNFLGDCKRGEEVAATQSTVKVTFEQNAEGYYAVTLYHDENDDKELNTEGLFGMPSEKYGFSNNPRILFGPPSFEKCRFKLSGDQTIRVELN